MCQWIDLQMCQWIDRQGCHAGEYRLLVHVMPEVAAAKVGCIFYMSKSKMAVNVIRLARLLLLKHRSQVTERAA